MPEPQSFSHAMRLAQQNPMKLKGNTMNAQSVLTVIFLLIWSIIGFLELASRVV